MLIKGHKMAALGVLKLKKKMCKIEKGHGKMPL